MGSQEQMIIDRVKLEFDEISYVLFFYLYELAFAFDGIIQSKLTEAHQDEGNLLGLVLFRR